MSTEEPRFAGVEVTVNFENSTSIDDLADPRMSVVAFYKKSHNSLPRSQTNLLDISEEPMAVSNINIHENSESNSSIDDLADPRMSVVASYKKSQNSLPRSQTNLVDISEEPIAESNTNIQETLPQDICVLQNTSEVENAIASQNPLPIKQDTSGDAEKNRQSIMVRSKSSFFLHTNVPLIEIRTSLGEVQSASEETALVNNSPTQQRAQSQSVHKQNSERNFKLASNLQPKSTKVEDTFLGYLEVQGFHGLWNHYGARLYFLLFLMWRKAENMMLLRVEIVDYRNNFYKLGVSNRIFAAKRIKKLFLTPNSSTYIIEWPVGISKSQIDDAMDCVNQYLEFPSIKLFDLVGLLSYQALEMLYDGKEVDSATNEDHMNGTSFKNSPFYQAMRNDFAGSAFSTVDQFRRGAERVVCHLNCHVYDNVLYEKIIAVLEDLRLESEFLQKEKKRPLQSSATIRGNTGNFVEDAASTSSLPLVSSQVNTIKYEISTAHHAFLLENEAPAAFCEYCYEWTSSEEQKLLYSCETCGVKIHKNCRSYMTFSCNRTSLEGDDQTTDIGSEAISFITEKLAALQKEIDIELHIQDGLEKLMKAKKNVKTTDLSAQLAKNTKRLDSLKHEMQKRTVQLQNMQAQSAAQNNAKLQSESRVNSSASLLKRSKSVKPIMAQADYNEIMDDTGLLRVVVIDPLTKLQFKKAVYISENQSTLEVIEVVLKKSNLLGNPSDFTLSYQNPKGRNYKNSFITPVDDLICLKDEDRPTQIENINYSETSFILRGRKEAVTFQDLNHPFVKKQQEIILEIVENEWKYLYDLKLISSVFYDPIQESGIIPAASIKELFSNIQQIIEIHERVCNEISWEYPDQEEKLNKIIECFSLANDEFICYEEYCGNQYQQRETLKKLMAQNQAFVKIIQKAESHPKLQKLTLQDMLMKPIQKITRYPLLFKRLLPNINRDSETFEYLTYLISNLETTIQKANETVRKREALWKIDYIDKSMEFGPIYEKFKIAIDERRFISESNMQYINSKADTSIDVVVLLFNDMVLITRKSKRVVGGYILYKQPIPLEQTVFLDQLHSEAIQIAHQKQEIHTLQAYSLYEKKIWLKEAEIQRIKLTSEYAQFEQTHLKHQLVNYKMRPPSPTLKATQIDETSYISSFFFASAKGKKSEDGENSEPTLKSPTSKFSPDDLINAKKRLSGTRIESAKVKEELNNQIKGLLKLDEGDDEDTELNIQGGHPSPSGRKVGSVKSVKQTNLMRKLKKKIMKFGGTIRNS